jgi:hypothetical protein
MASYRVGMFVAFQILPFLTFKGFEGDTYLIDCIVLAFPFYIVLSKSEPLPNQTKKETIGSRGADIIAESTILKAFRTEG